MTVTEAVRHGTERLTKHSTSPRLDAEVLMAHLFKTDRADLLTKPEEQLNADQEQSYHGFIEARRQGWPVAYVTNHQPFAGLSLYVTPDVLVPRPATELLVDAILGRVAPEEKVAIADIGTGSGAIALALAMSLPHAQIVATDISPQALSIAHYNARHSQLTGRITFHHGSLLEPLQRLAQLDIIVANLPYLRPEQMAEPSIQAEPRLALAGGRDGLLLVWRLLDQLHLVHPFRGLVLELDPSQTDVVGSHLAAQWPQYQVNDITDGQATHGVAMWER